MGGIYWLASYPKSGNTWFRAFLQNLQADAEQPVRINELATGSIASGRGWLDEVLGFDTADLLPDEVEALRPPVYAWSAREGQGDTGYHKVHDAYTRLPGGQPLLAPPGVRGALYIVRNPLDVAPSAANHWHMTLDQAIERMGQAAFCIADPRRKLSEQVRQRLQSWSQHVLGWADAPDLPIQVLRYEDMLADPLPTFTQAARFLQLPDAPERVAKAIRFSAFKELAAQEAAGGFKERPHHTGAFFRSGQSGGWRQTLNPEQVARLVHEHGEVMRRFGYLDGAGQPV